MSSRGAGTASLPTMRSSSIADLKGKMVAFPKGTVSQFFLNVLLKEAGLSEADIETVDLSADDAGNAFLMREVDAAVTWEPWLTDGKNAEHGRLLANIPNPGLLVDCLTAKAAVFEDRQDDFAALARAWDAALDYVEAHPDEANQMMARHVGGWLEDPAVFAETLKGRPVLRRSQGTENTSAPPDRPGPIYQTSQYAIEVWRSLGALDSPADAGRRHQGTTSGTDSSPALESQALERDFAKRYPTCSYCGVWSLTLAKVWFLASLLALAHAEPLRGFHFTWVGFGPLFVAQDKGFFAQEGLEVSLIQERRPTPQLLPGSPPVMSMRSRVAAGCRGLLRAG